MTPEQIALKYAGDGMIQSLADEIKRSKLEWIKPYAEMLKIAQCPDCNGSGSYAIPNHKTGEPEQQQCRWCFERNLLLNDHAKTP